MNDNIIASFSGGKTSAYMTYLLKKEYGDKLKVVFMFRGRRKSNDLVSMQDLNNKSNGCEESCEVF
jgi:tRNA(Ile)-lysidine synthase TilS/MesJ